MPYISLPCYRVAGFPRMLPQKAAGSSHISWMMVPNYELHAARLHAVLPPLEALAAAAAWWRLAFFAANGPLRSGGWLVTRAGGRFVALGDGDLAAIVGVDGLAWEQLRRGLMAGSVALLELTELRIEVSDEEARAHTVHRPAIDRQLSLELPIPAHGVGTGSQRAEFGRDRAEPSMAPETTEAKEGRKDFGSLPRRGELDYASNGGRPAAAPHGGAESVGRDAEAAGRAVLSCLSAAEAGNRRAAHHGWVTALAQYLCSDGPTAADVEQWTVIFANTYDGDAAPRQRVARLGKVLAAAERIRDQWQRHLGGEAEIRNRAAKFASWCQRMGILHRARARPQRS